MAKEDDVITEEMIEAAILNANNFGEAADMWHPDYGWIVKNGKTTKQGILFFLDNKKKFEGRNNG